MSELLKRLQKARRESGEACLAGQLEKLGFRGLRPRAQEPTSEADIKAEITATLEEVKTHIRANAKEAPEPSAAPQREPVPPPQEESTPSNFAEILAQALKEAATRQFDAASQQEQPVVCPHMLLAFGLLMRHVGHPYKCNKPNRLQRAVQRVGRHLAKGSGISTIDLFKRAHRADIEARRHRLEAKIARDSKPRKPTK